MVWVNPGLLPCSDRSSDRAIVYSGGEIIIAQRIYALCQILKSNVLFLPGSFEYLLYLRFRQQVQGVCQSIQSIIDTDPGSDVGFGETKPTIAKIWERSNLELTDRMIVPSASSCHLSH